MPPSGPSDAELLADWLQRHREPAFHALVARYAGLVHMAAKRTCGDDTLAAEASQLTFITLARKAKSLASRSSLAGWLHLTAVLQAKNLLRHHQRETRKRQLLRTHMDTDTQASPADAWQRMQPVLDEAPGLGDAAEREQRLDLLLEAILALPERCRQVMMLRHLDGLAYKEIAERLEISPETVKVHMIKGVKDCTRFFRQRGLLGADNRSEGRSPLAGDLRSAPDSLALHRPPAGSYLPVHPKLV